MRKFKRTEGIPTREAEKGELVAIDLEMAGQVKDRLHRPHGKFAALVIAIGKESFLITDKADLKKAIARVRKGTWIFHKARYDIVQLRGLGVSIAERYVWDTMIVEKVLFSGLYRYFSLAACARRHLDVYMDKDVRAEFGEMSVDDKVLLSKAQKIYTFLDGEITLQVAEAQKAILEDGEDDLMAIYNDLEQPLIWAMLRALPAHVEPDLWRQIVDGFEVAAQTKQANLGFNVQSPKQTHAAILEATGISLTNRDGKDSTAKDLLREHFDGDPIFREIAVTRAMRKCVSTYGKTWLDKFLEPGNLVVSEVNTYAAATGRMSYTRPPLQTIPIRDEFEIGSSRYRECFTSRYPDGRLIVSDVSAQEPRITAFYSQDPELIAAFERDEDIHQFVADGLAEILGREVSRDVGKATGLGITYGQSAKGLAEKVGVTPREGAAFIRGYFQRFPGVAAWKQQQISKIDRFGFVETAAGRRFWVNPYARGRAERHVMNAPVQGGAADMTKLAILYIDDAAKFRREDSPLVMQIHDEIVLDLPSETEAKRWVPIVEEAWEQAALYLFPGVPFKAGTGIGIDWAVKS